MSIISVDQLCVAVQTTLDVALPEVFALPEVLAYLDGEVYAPVTNWQQLPTTTALAAASLPAGAISSPGMVQPPKFKRSQGAWETEWRVAVGIYERGRNHDDTQARVRNWCAFIRTALQRHPTLGGVAGGLRWAGEEYALLPNKDTARTIAAGAVAFDVAALVADTLMLGAPSVASTQSTLSVRPPQE